jgi:hypothetical protein
LPPIPNVETDVCLNFNKLAALHELILSRVWLHMFSLLTMHLRYCGFLICSSYLRTLLNIFPNMIFAGKAFTLKESVFRNASFLSRIICYVYVASNQTT